MDAFHTDNFREAFDFDAMHQRTVLIELWSEGMADIRSLSVRSAVITHI